MKKLLALVLVAGMATFVACGPSKADLEAKAKKTQDSLDAIAKEKRTADSLAAVEKAKKEADSLAAIEKNKPKGNQGVQGGTKPNTGGGTKTQEQINKDKIKAGRG